MLELSILVISFDLKKGTLVPKCPAVRQYSSNLFQCSLEKHWKTSPRKHWRPEHLAILNWRCKWHCNTFRLLSVQFLLYVNRKTVPWILFTFSFWDKLWVSLIYLLTSGQHLCIILYYLHLAFYWLQGEYGIVKWWRSSCGWT